MLSQEKAKSEQAVVTNGELEGEKDVLRRKLAERDNECQDLEQRLRGSQTAVKKMQQQKEDVQMELDQVSAQVSGIGRLEGKYRRFECEKRVFFSIYTNFGGFFFIVF